MRQKPHLFRCLPQGENSVQSGRFSSPISKNNVKVAHILPGERKKMRLSENVQSRVVAVLVSLFLGFVMPWVLQANRDFRGEAQFRFDPSAMFASTVAEVLVSTMFAAVFVVSLLYLANQSNSRKLLLFADAISLVAFAGFTMTYSLFVHGSVYGWIYYALSQMFPGQILMVGYITAAIAAPLIKPSSMN